MHWKFRKFSHSHTFLNDSKFHLLTCASFTGIESHTVIVYLSVPICVNHCTGHKSIYVYIQMSQMGRVRSYGLHPAYLHVNIFNKSNHISISVREIDLLSTLMSSINALSIMTLLCHVICQIAYNRLQVINSMS